MVYAVVSKTTPKQGCGFESHSGYQMIYVDKLRKYRKQSYCHMISDVSISDLHHFALKIGISRQWFHKDHYDLREGDRMKAIVAGAKEVSSREIVKILNRHGRVAQMVETRGT